MKKEYMNALVQLTEIMDTMEIVALKHGVTYYYWIVKFFDPSKQDDIHTICEENNLEWDVKPAPFKQTNGGKTSTGYILNDLRNKKKPLQKGVLPRELARAKIIIHEKKNRRNRR